LAIIFRPFVSLTPNDRDF